MVDGQRSKPLKQDHHPAGKADLTMPLIVFSHANSFAASTYRVLFRLLRARGFKVRGRRQIRPRRNTRSPTTGRTWYSNWWTSPRPRSRRPASRRSWSAIRWAGS
jgi:hypothetical protein